MLARRQNKSEKAKFEMVGRCRERFIRAKYEIILRGIICISGRRGRVSYTT
jgi:hypothetical protein